MRLPVAGGGYFRLFPYAVIRTAFRSLQRAGRPVVFYLHPWDLDPGQPIDRLPASQRFRQTVGAGRAAGKLSRLLKEFAFAPLSIVLNRLHIEEDAP